MKLETAHIVLIGTAIGFFAILAALQGARWLGGQGGGSALMLAAGSAVAAVVFALYLRSFLRNLKRA